MEKGGEGYALEQLLSDTTRAQLRSRENLARSDLPRRLPRGIYGWEFRVIEDCMEVIESLQADFV